MVPDLVNDLTTERAVLIDVREQDEWKELRVCGAIHLPMSQLKQSGIPNDLPQDKRLYVHCRRGVRACKAAKLLRQHYPDVVSVKFNPTHFQAMGLPVEP